MGGSSGGFFGGDSDPEELIRKLERTTAETLSNQFEVEVADAISSLLTDFNNRDIDATSAHLKTIEEALEGEIEGTLELLFGGSVAKHTFINGLSDVDALVLLDKSELQDMKPEEVKEYFYESLQQRLPKTEIQTGDLAVTVSFGDMKIQLVPAIRHGDGYRIADPSGQEWSVIRPREFTESLSRINDRNGGKVIPTIKLEKSAMSSLVESRKLTGYHVESLAAEIFQEYDGPNSPKSMVKHFFSEASTRVLTSIRDISGQSENVDDYLGPSDSEVRQAVANSLGRISRRMNNADKAQLVELWRELLEPVS